MSRRIVLPLLAAATLTGAAFATAHSRAPRQPSPPPYPNPAIASSLWKVPVAGGRPRLLLHDRGWQDSDPIVLRDGSTIVFERPTSLSTTGLFMLRPGRPHPVWLRNLPELAALGYSSRRELLAMRRGRRIVAETIRGRTVRVLARVESSGWSVPAWSADGKSLAYAQTVRTPANPYQGEIVVERHGTTRRFPLPGSAGPLSFSPRGDRLIISWGRALAILDTDTGGRRPLAEAGSFAAWSPDGRTIAYNGRDGLVALDLASNRRHVVSPAGGWATFTPDGKYLVFVTLDSRVR